MYYLYASLLARFSSAPIRLVETLAVRLHLVPLRLTCRQKLPQLPMTRQLKEAEIVASRQSIQVVVADA